MPTQLIPSQVHVDRVLTTLAFGYDQGLRDSVAMRAFTVIPVQEGSARYKFLDKGKWYMDQVKVRPLGGAGDLATYDMTDQWYACEEYSLRHRIDDRVTNLNSSAFDLLETGTNMLLRQHQIRRDRVWATRFFKPGVWTWNYAGVVAGAGSGTAGAPGAGQVLRFDQSGSDPIAVINAARVAARQGTGFTPNVLIIGADVELNFITHPALVDRIKYGGAANSFVDNALLAQAFGVEEVITPAAIYNAAAEGQAINMTWQINSKGMLLLYRAQRAALDGSTPTAGAVFAWQGLLGGAANGEGTVVERRRAPPEAHSDEVEVRSAWDMQPVALDLGVYFDNVVP